MKKERIFSKFNTRNFNNELEEILDQKSFSENIKNNILNMVYKIEEAYDDYATVKVEVQDEKDFLDKIIKSIKDYCNSIKILNATEMDGNSYKIDYKNGKITTVTNSIWILYALLKLLKEKKRFYNESDVISKKPIYELLNVGYNINSVEVIRDFNGWSWINSLDEIENVNVNLIYQNLQFLLGNKAMEKIISGSNKEEIDFFEILENNISKKYNKEISQKIMNILKRIAIVEISNIDGEYKNTLIEIKNRKQEELTFMNNKKEYLKEISYIKKTNIEVIKGIDKTINDKDLLRLEYKSRNSMLKNSEKIFSISYLVEILNEERNEALEKIAEVNTLMDPKEYVKKKEEIEKIIEEISVNEEAETDDEENIIKMQQLFIECFLKQINNLSEKTEIIDMLYKVRYYINISYDKNKCVKELIQIKDEIENLKCKIIEKLLEQKIVFKFSDDDKINKEILLKVLDTRIINLQTIYISLSLNKNELKVEIYDEENDLDSVETIILEDTKNKNLKLDKKIKLFV